MPETKIYAHRGSKGNYPENTLLSFQQGINEGADGIELDVHLTKDNEVVVIHDDTLDRTTTGTGAVKAYTLDDIRQFSAGSKFTHLDKYETKWDLERVPTLKEVLELLAPNEVELNIELKTNSTNYVGIEEKVLDIVKEYSDSRSIVYSSFHLPSLLRLKKIDKSANIAWLLNHPISHPIDHIDTLNFEALHLNRNMILANKEYWQDLYPSIRAWTVNEEEEMQELLDLHVDSIITDYPATAVSLRNKKKALS